MNRQDFINAHKHKLCGIMLDAAIAGRTGAQLAVWCRMMMQQVDAELGVIYDSFQPKPASPPVKPTETPNGKPAPAAGVQPGR